MAPKHNSLKLKASIWTSLLLSLLADRASSQRILPAPTSNTITAVSECHLHSATQFCMEGTNEYRVIPPATQTAELSSTYTDCHTHGSNTYCVAPDGEEVEIVSAEANSTEQSHHREEGEVFGHAGLNCHFHAGVEHCVDKEEAGSDSRTHCEKVDRDYNIPLRIGLLFVMLVTSSLGVFGPILLASTRLKLPRRVFIVLKQFGTGVIFSTAFVHLSTHATLVFNNECLGELGYEATASSIIMAGVFLSFLLEYLSRRCLQWRIKSKETEGLDYSNHSVKKLNIAVLEGGIIFHSLLIGLTLVVAGDSFFITLFVVILFHQMFEGIALGTRIAELSAAYITLTKKLLMALPFALITSMGMAIGIGVIQQFNGNDPATLIAIGILDAFSSGILIWVGLVEMWAHDWVFGEMANTSVVETGVGLFSLMAGALIMSVLAKWA
ncbi:zinc/iron transporter [Delitschia confertaspora ATCC 74209]|uniref:Zinc/iron transporter n=1 Tax=Delitschia confertaspora ATCC 74209 TaxID=1513339 RepID=A0A9P4JF18_9PLEO|nr:zinc/iron transporter [Delitschia confertaspora ATCC 74209]